MIDIFFGLLKITHQIEMRGRLMINSIYVDLKFSNEEVTTLTHLCVPTINLKLVERQIVHKVK